MTGLFKSIYDWLLRTFWYVFLLRWGLVATHFGGGCSVATGRDHPLRVFSSEPCGNDDFLYFRSTEMDVTMIGLQNAGKTSLLRVLAVRHINLWRRQRY